MSLLAEIERQIGLTTPGHRMVDLVEEDGREALLNNKAGMLKKVDSVFAEGDMLLGQQWQTLSKTSYPWHKNQSAANVKRMQSAEKALDELWAKFDGYFVQRRGKTVHEMLKGILTPRTVRRTPDWTESVRQSSSKRDEEATDPAATRLAALELEKKTESTISDTPNLQASERQKVKTRGTPHTASQDPHSPQTEQQQATHEPDHPIFKVGKCGIRVFRALFHVPTDALSTDPFDDAGTPGEIPWTDFLSAMTSVGFSVRKLDGSAWVFAPVRDDFHRSIIFHEPHPSSKIPYQIARRFGRRLERVFGWTAEWFERG